MIEMQSMARISVEPLEASIYRVSVDDAGMRTVHDVTVQPDDIARYAPSGTTAERLIEVSFEFLLEREPQGAILQRFALPVIERYFAEYPRMIRKML